MSDRHPKRPLYKTADGWDRIVFAVVVFGALALLLLLSLALIYATSPPVLTDDDKRAALLDPEYHRYLMFGRADKALEMQRQRPLEYHESQARLPAPQRAIIERCERAIAARNAEILVIRSSRQTGKNEIEAMLEARVLSIFRSVPGSCYVRAAPTWRPQIVQSKQRLAKHLRSDPLIAGRYQSSEGFIYESGHAQIQFMTAGRTANVEGATASIALSVDEAHKIDRDKFDEAFAPFTASTAAPTFLWGVAAAKQDLLYRYRQDAEGTDRLLEFPAAVWCEMSAAYDRHYRGRVKLLGASHPIILTQYDLVDIESIGAYLSDAHRSALFSGDHPRLEQPRPGRSYYLVADLGGEAEEQQSDTEVREADPQRDSTYALIAEVDPADGDEPYPLARIVQGHWWTGRQHMAVLPDLLRLCDHWGFVGGVVDARGVGEAVAMAVHRAHPCVEAYKATSETVSQDCYDFLARVNTGRVRFWQADPAADDEYRELAAQSRHTRYTIRGHQLMALQKPVGKDAAYLHIDGVKALTYLGRAIDTEYAGLLGYMRQPRPVEEKA